MRVRLLGPIEVGDNGRLLPLPGLRRKAVLAVLALHAGEIVSTDRLIDVVWGDRPPATALNTLQSHVSYLRRILGSRDAIAGRPPGYVLDLEPDDTDVRLAERLVAEGRRATDPAEAANRLRTALALWRGRPLADVAGLPWLDEQAERIDQIRLVAVQALTDARLALGEHGQLVPELELLAAHHPFQEPIHGQLVLALYRAGRPADALAAYQRLRRTLGEDLGIDPSPALRDLANAVRRQDPALRTAARGSTPVPAPGGAVPAQLPLAVAAFAGRDSEVARLDEILAAASATGAGRPATVVVSALLGTAGVGKTALAVHWAHRVRDHFPDGQLYVNLRGFDPAGAAMDPAEAIRGFLDAFGVPPARVPAGLAARSALYRSVLAGKRVLVVLDNARDPDQIRPLLPGSAGSVAVVTSRNRLTSLVAIEGAHPVTLDVLPVPQARDLLARRLGADRVAAEPAPVAEIVARCAGLPLALAVTAARAATSPDVALATLADELRDAGPLSPLSGGDRADVRTVFSWSYRTLSPDAARLFRLLGLHPGPDVSAPAAASLAGQPVGEVAPLLGELSRAHLLDEPAPDRYTFHDLLRAYARELAAGDGEATRHAARRRAYDHYLHTALGADRLLFPQREPITVPAPAAGVVPEIFGSDLAAMAWFDAEHAVIFAAIEQAADGGFDRQLWALAWATTTFLYRRGRIQELAETQSAALDAARRQDDTPSQARTHGSLGRIYSRLRRYEEAQLHLKHALDLYTQLADPIGSAHIHVDLAALWGDQDRYTDALYHGERALDLFHRAGHGVGEGRALNTIGWYHAQVGAYEQALDHCQRALARQQDIGERDGQALTLDSLGYIHRCLGQHAEAVGRYQQAIDLYREMANRHGEANVSDHLGDAHRIAGTLDDARLAWQHAVALFAELGHPDAEQVRAKLRLHVTRYNLPGAPPRRYAHATPTRE